MIAFTPPFALQSCQQQAEKKCAAELYVTFREHAGDLILYDRKGPFGQKAREKRKMIIDGLRFDHQGIAWNQQLNGLFVR